MLLILLFLLGIVVWGFFHSNPVGVPKNGLLACNAGILVLAAAAAALIGIVLYQHGLRVKADEPGLATYLAIMGSGTAFLFVVTLGGMVRNLFVFPLSRRTAPHEKDA